MYSKSQLLLKYLQYYFAASNGKGHGIHSPFVFEFIIKVLNDNSRYSEYEKAIDNLTINEENRLKRKMEKIESEKSQIELIELKHQMDLEKVKRDYNKVISLIQQNPKLAHAKPEALVGKGKN